MPRKPLPDFGPNYMNRRVRTRTQGGAGERKLQTLPLCLLTGLSPDWLPHLFTDWVSWKQIVSLSVVSPRYVHSFGLVVDRHFPCAVNTSIRLPKGNRDRILCAFLLMGVGVPLLGAGLAVKEKHSNDREYWLESIF